MDNLKSPKAKQSPAEPLIHDMVAADKSQPLNTKLIYILAGVVIVAGIVSGLVLAKNKSAKTVSGTQVSTSLIGGKKTFGSADTTTFKDMAQGTLQKGGIDGEGTHKLIRPGGDSQTVYLTSTVLDLDQFIGKKIKVWGETNSAKKAGWLMDVGRIEIE